MLLPRISRCRSLQRLVRSRLIHKPTHSKTANEWGTRLQAPSEWVGWRIEMKVPTTKAVYNRPYLEVIMQIPVEANFGAILDAAPDAMLVVDQQGRIVLANIQSEQIFGYSRAELTGQKIEVLVPPRFRAKH